MYLQITYIYISKLEPGGGMSEGVIDDVRHIKIAQCIAASCETKNQEVNSGIYIYIYIYTPIYIYIYVCINKKIYKHIRERWRDG